MTITSHTVKISITERERETLVGASIILRELGISLTGVLPKFEKEVHDARCTILTVLESEITDTI